MGTRKDLQVHVLIIVIAVISALIILYEVLVNGDKFLDHLAFGTMALALLGTGIMGFNEIKKK